MSAADLDVDLEPEVLRWARQRAGLSDAALAERAGVPLERVSEWERTGRLGLRQVERLALVTHTPLGYLYLPRPPEERLQLPDFRVLGDEALGQPSPDLIDVIDEAERRHQWYREYVVVGGANPLEFVGRLSEDTNPVEAAQSIRDRHGLTPELRASAATWEEALRLEVERIEVAGVLVMRNGVVGNNTHRPLDVAEFRGFAIADPYAPLIFINARDARAAQMFTLMHELVHIWLGRSGVSNPDMSRPPTHHTERFSNAVAAEILVPEAAIRATWAERGQQEDALAFLTRQFKVSSLVVLRRLFDIGAIEWDAFRAQYEGEVGRFLATGAREEQGGDFYRTQAVRSGKRFAVALVEETLEGRTPWREALSLLSIRSPDTFREFARRLRVSE